MPPSCLPYEENLRERGKYKVMASSGGRGGVERGLASPYVLDTPPLGQVIAVAKRRKKGWSTVVTAISL